MFIIGLMMVFSFSSCVGYTYATTQDDIYVEAETDVVRSNVDFNILFLDELFSNMDANTRNIMLNLLNETISKEKSIFVVNHAEMADDYFDHKIRVALQNKKIKSDLRGVDDVIIRYSKYENIF